MSAHDYVQLSGFILFVTIKFREQWKFYCISLILYGTHALELHDYLWYDAGTQFVEERRNVDCCVPEQNVETFICSSKPAFSGY